ncbi:basement membrane-specific heparan sulfate proteoglycan core protein [Cebidichthys violaceus]|uniref:basement membrane-specific heparan sulfate proteoglycan core protein n=1 Tax=Cebidichthys violaceus TaxID=271503 RepID=UPI0035C99D0F
MRSSVMKNLQTLALLALATFFISISGSLPLLPVLTGPDVAYVGSRAAFRCVAPNSSLPVTYELIRNGSVLVATVADLQEDQTASFYLKVAATMEGSYRCKATTRGSTAVSNSIKLTVVTPASNTRVTSEPFPPVAYEGSRIELSCSVAKGSHLFYTWFFNRTEVTSSTSPLVLLTGNKLVMGKVAPEHAGYYYCMAWSRVQDTRRFSSSSEVQVTVKVYVSKPRISFSISKEGGSRRGNVTCWSTRGSPPVNISLSVDDTEVGSVTAAQSLVAWFPVPVEPGQHTAVARCRVKTEVQELMSEPVTLEMVPVGGDVKVEVEYLYSADSRLTAAKLSCQVSRGTFPLVSWLLNNSGLPSETDVDSAIPPVLYHGALTDCRRTLVLAKLGPEESGYYRCRARDSYNDSGSWVESPAVLVRATEVFLTTIEVLTITFCCLLFLTLAVAVGCVYKMFDHKQETFCVARRSVAIFKVRTFINDCSSTMSASLFVVLLGFCICSKGSSWSILGRPEVIGPSEALVKRVVEFQCELKVYPDNETILLQLFKKDNRDKLLGEFTSLNGEVGTIPMVIKPYHEGGLECVARAQNNSNIEPTVSDTHYLKVVEPVKGAEIAVRSGPMDFFEGQTLELHCELIAGNHVSYKWLLNGQLVPQSPLHHAADNTLLIDRTTSEDSGSYTCVASNHFNETIFNSSSDVMITVKDVVSAPDVSFTVLKEDSFKYSAEVTCQSTRGTPPVTFSLYNRTDLVANITIKERNAIFKVPLVLGQHLGWLQCQANNGDRTEFSQWIPLEVVPVGGPVTMHYDYDVGENYAVIGLKFYCKAAKGSLPRYQWFLNNTLLHDRGSFYYVVNQPPEQSMLLLSVGRRSAGTYHCEVSDSFDNSSSIRSNWQYLDKEALHRLPVSVVAVVFGCFTFLVVLVSICCLVGVMFRRSQHGGRSLLSLEMKGMEAAYEGELDLSEYNEDAELVTMARGGEFDQASEASVDEWPHIEEEKKTLEDEAVEGF